MAASDRSGGNCLARSWRGGSARPTNTSGTTCAAAGASILASSAASSRGGFWVSRQGRQVMLGSPIPVDLFGSPWCSSRSTRLTIIGRAIVSGARTCFGRFLAALHESRRREAAIVRARYRHLNCPLSELGQEAWPHLAKLDRCARDARKPRAFQPRHGP
jgi:hypothetical protein